MAGVEEAVGVGGVDGPLGCVGDDDKLRRYCWWPNCGGVFYPAAALGGGREFGFCQVATCYDSFANTRARHQLALESLPGPSVFPPGPSPKWGGLFPVQPPGPPPGYPAFVGEDVEEGDGVENEGDEAFVGEDVQEDGDGVENEGDEAAFVGEEVQDGDGVGGDGEEVFGPSQGFGVVDAVKVEDEEEAVVGGTASSSSRVPEDNEINKLLINN